MVTSLDTHTHRRVFSSILSFGQISFGTTQAKENVFHFHRKLFISYFDKDVFFYYYFLNMVQ